MLATNVAETSLTVPGIRYVVDTGLARISRYSARTKVQRLPIEPISQASANQRAGRCGRVADGICIRLYAEEDYLARPEFTEPEILRTNLAAVILQMTALGLGDVAQVPVRRAAGHPRGAGRDSAARGDRGASRSGEARSARGDIGGRSPYPGRLEPKSDSRSVAAGPAADRPAARPDARGGLHASAACGRSSWSPRPLSMQDPRERPADQQEQADQLHRRFADPESDFAGILNLWRYIKEQQDELSSSAFRRMCKRELPQLPAGTRVAGPGLAAAPGREAARPALNNDTGRRARPSTRRCWRVCCRTSGCATATGGTTGARGTRFAVFPGSALFKKPPEFVMAAELVETSRLWARVNARIDPAWAEELGAHLLKRTYSEPHWEKKRGAVMALEKVTLYGVPIVLRAPGQLRPDRPGGGA